MRQLCQFRGIKSNKINVVQIVFRTAVTKFLLWAALWSSNAITMTTVTGYHSGLAGRAGVSFRGR